MVIIFHHYTEINGLRTQRVNQDLNLPLLPTVKLRGSCGQVDRQTGDRVRVSLYLSVIPGESTYKSPDRPRARLVRRKGESNVKGWTDYNSLTATTVGSKCGLSHSSCVTSKKGRKKDLPFVIHNMRILRVLWIVSRLGYLETISSPLVRSSR